MPYIGKEPTTGNFIYADDITTSATNTYNILVGGVAFSPESANHLIVSLNGVIQKANTSFSVSGSQITFLPSSGTLSSSDSIDFILILGTVNAVGVATTVSDQAITKAKTNFVSSGSGYTGTGLDIKGDGSANGRLGLLCSAGTHGVALESPNHSSAQSYTIQLPSNSPTVNKVIKVTSLTGSGATAIAHTQFDDAGGTTAPYVSVYRNGDQSISDATHTKIEFNAENVDSGTAFDSSTNYRYTPQTSGYYFVSLNAGTGAQSDNATDKIIASIYKNGSAVTGAVATRDWDTNGINYNDQVNTSVIVQLNGSSDYIEGYVYIDSTSGTPRVESGQASMHIFKMTE